MKKLWKWIKENDVYAVTFLLASIIMGIAWKHGEVAPFFGKQSLMLVDGVHQYLPFFSEYQEKLRTMDSLQYTFDVGMGNNFVSLWSYYLSSPFNLLILLFSKRNIPVALNLVITIKMILGCVCFAYYLRHRDLKLECVVPAGKKSKGGKKTKGGKRAKGVIRTIEAEQPVKDWGVVAFSLFYGFSNFILGYHWNLMWLDSIYIFPIILLGMRRLMEGKDSRLYVFTLLYSFVCNYYISFMICMFLVLWFFTFRFDNVKDFFMKGLRFAAGSLIAAALSAVVLVPAYKGIMTTASAEFSLPEWEFYGSFADTLRSHLFRAEVFTNQVEDSGTNLYCGIFTILLAVMYLFLKDVKLAQKVKYVLILVLFVVSFNEVRLNYIWHGFHNQYGIPNRFAFLYIFLLVLMAYDVWKKKEQLWVPGILISYALCALFVAFCYYQAEETYDNITYILSGVLLTAYLVFLLLYRLIPKPLIRTVFMWGMIAIAVIEAGANSYNGFDDVGSSDMEYYYGQTEPFEELKEWVEDEEESEFCRSDILQPIPVDEAVWYNLKSVGIFGSTVRGELVDLMGKLGFYTGANEYLYYGATPVTNALFGVKYVYVRDNNFNNLDMEYYDKEDNISVYRNNYVLPIGYMVKEDILDYDPENAGPFTVLNEVSGALTGYEPVFCSIYDDLQTRTYGTNMEVTMRDEFNADFSNANGSARGDIIYTIPRDMDLYVSCRGTNVKKIALLIDGNEVGYDRYQGQLFHVGKMTTGQTVDIQFELNEGDDQSGELYVYPMEFSRGNFENFYNTLFNQGMEVTSFGSTQIEGLVTAEEGQMFMTSIPYDDGWHIYVDGEETDTWIILDGFLGAELDPGEHEIRMVYRCPGMVKGFFLTVFGILCMIGLCRIESGQIDIAAIAKKYNLPVLKRQEEQEK